MKHRQVVIFVNRLARAVNRFAHAVALSPARAVPLLEHMANAGGVPRNGWLDSAELRLARLLLSMPAGYSIHMSWLIPWRYAVVMQVLLTISIAATSSKHVCWLLTHAPDLRALFMPTCTAVSRSTHLAASLLGMPAGLFAHAAGNDDAACAAPLTAAAALMLFSNLLVLLMLPVAYFGRVEWLLKGRWLRRRQRQQDPQQQQQQEWQLEWQLANNEDVPTSSHVMMPPAVITVIACMMVALLAAWAVASKVASSLPPLACDAQGWLVLSSSSMQPHSSPKESSHSGSSTGTICAAAVVAVGLALEAVHFYIAEALLLL
jgi:hypothetical protein